MYARVSFTRYPGENRDAGMKIVEHELIPALKVTKGYRGYYLLGDGKPGMGLAIVMWETEADADASATAPGIAEASAKLAALGLEVESRKMYEIVLQA